MAALGLLRVARGPRQGDLVQPLLHNSTGFWLTGAFLHLGPCLCCRYGFVEFEDNRDADDAVYELNGKELCGERVIVEHARGPRRDRDFYGGGYGAGGRSKSSLLPNGSFSFFSGEVSNVTVMASNNGQP